MTNLRCETVRDALPALGRGTEEPATSAALREHVAGCAACAAELRLAEALVAARGTDAPAGLAERVAVALAAAGTRPHGRRTLPRAIRWTAGAGLAAAAMIALVLAWPERAPDRTAPRETAVADASVGRADPFLDDDLFAGDAAPLDAQLDDVLEGVDAEAVAFADDAGALPPLALDLGSPLGDWPGADGTTAGGMTLDDLTYEEMQLLLSEMDT